MDWISERTKLAMTFIDRVGFPILAFLLIFGAFCYGMVSTNGSVKELTGAMKEMTGAFNNQSKLLVEAINTMQNDRENRRRRYQP